MKIYVLIETTYFESEGIDSEAYIFENRKDAVKQLESDYDNIKGSYDEDDVEWDNFEDDGYSFCANNEYGEFERYEGKIVERLHIPTKEEE